MKTYLCLCRVQGLGHVAFVAHWFGKRTVIAVGSHLKSGPGQVIPPFINETNSTCQEVPASCQDSYPEGVPSLMRQQTSHQMEGVIKGLKVKITSLMEGRAYWANGEDIPNRGTGCSVTTLQIRSCLQCIRPTRYLCTEARRQGGQAVVLEGGGEMESQARSQSVGLRLFISVLECSSSDSLNKVTSLLGAHFAYP